MTCIHTEQIGYFQKGQFLARVLEVFHSFIVYRSYKLKLLCKIVQIISK